MTERPDMQQVDWRLPLALIDHLREFQEDQRLASPTEAARVLLERALAAWEAERQQPDW